jgi:transcriptional regulator GlxA family with amidase domain
MQVGILVFDEVEVLDACGPFEVFSVASRVRDAGDDPITVSLVGAIPGEASVTARGGLRLLVDRTIADAPPFDVLIVPGGVTTAVERDAAVVAWIRDRASTPTVASVCTGAFLLAEAGLITDHVVTTHWEDQAELADRYPELTVIDGERWVGGGGLYTSAGISAGLDLGLHLVAELVSPERAARTARQMDYAWQRQPTVDVPSESVSEIRPNRLPSGSSR